MIDIVLFGAGELGREALQHLRSIDREPCCFADSRRRDPIDGIEVLSPEEARQRYPEAYWCPTVLSLPASIEVPEMIRAMGVARYPLYQALPICMENRPYRKGPRLGRAPSFDRALRLQRLFMHDHESVECLVQQFQFYTAPDYFLETVRRPISEIYFPDFIQKHPREHFVDCGAADGDSLKLYWQRYGKDARATAFEPDEQNCTQLLAAMTEVGATNTQVIPYAVSNEDKTAYFRSDGYGSRICDPGEKGSIVDCVRIDDLYLDTPTYIKMDVEGEECKALSGARLTIQHYHPVLAICAYHETDDFLDIPELIHEIDPDYVLFFRRYTTVPFELICYAVPPERVVRFQNSYSDDLNP